MKKAVLLVFLALSSVSNLVLSAAEAQPSQTTIKWNSAQLSGAQKNCSNSALKATNNKVSAKVVNSYCECALGTAARRYEYVDFAKNEKKYTELMTKEGVIKKCAQSAQSAK